MTPKLTDAFNKHAEKVVDILDLDNSVLSALQKNLDATEMRAFMIAASAAKPIAAYLPEDAVLYVGNTHAGSESLFIKVDALAEAFAKTAGSYGSIQSKVEDTFAAAIEKADDYSADAKAGKFTTLPMPH